MAEIVQQQKQKHKRPRLVAPRVDMTPLVDLAFLLLTFFVLTAELSKENAISVKYPANGEPTLVNNGLTLLVGKNPEKIFWYRGEFDPAMHLNSTGVSNAGLLNVLYKANESVCANINVIDRQHNLGLLTDAAWNTKRNSLLGSESIPTVVVKWNDDASYQTIVKVIDELNRTHNGKYAIVPMSDAEKRSVN
jgi:biopolymer transport protein ExbD